MAGKRMGENGMRKILFLTLGLVLGLSLAAQALETTLIDSRNEILQNAQEMKTYFTTTRDPVLLNNMWDSSALAVSQLDAYFSMLGIFNTIKKENLDEAAFNYLIKWLNQVKDSTALEIKSLDAVNKTADARSKVLMLKTKGIFNNFIARVTKELQTVSQYQATLKKQ
jgi:hypothetical protein